MPARLEIDAELLRLIAETRTSSAAELARLLDVSPSTVKRRLRESVEAGVLSLRMVVNDHRIGLPVSVRFYLDVAPERGDAVERALVDLPPVTFVARTEGLSDLVAFGHFADDADLATFTIETLGGIAGVRRLRTAHVIRWLKASYGGDRPEAVGEEGAAESASEVRHRRPVSDDRLIALLRAPDPLSVPELAAALGVHETTVRRRLSALEAQGILSRRLVIHPEMLGFAVYALFLIEATVPRLREAAFALAALPELAYVDLMAGEFNIYASGFFTSETELEGFTRDRLARIPGLLRVERSTVRAVLKAQHRGVPIIPQGDVPMPRLRPPGAN